MTDVFRVVDVWAVAGADDFRSAVLVADVNVDATAGTGVGCREPSETKKDIIEMRQLWLVRAGGSRVHAAEKVPKFESRR